MNPPRQPRLLLALAGSLAIGACASAGPGYQTPDSTSIGIPKKWAAQQQTAQRSVELERWWTQLNDPLLSVLIEAAQAASPSVDKALARIRQARSGLVSSKAPIHPSLSHTLAADRGGSLGVDRAEDRVPVTTRLNATLDATWEIDLFGGTRRSVEAAQARVEVNEANWHEARVSLAAELATAYVTRRHCEGLLVLAEADLASRSETQRLNLLKLDAGFASPSDADRTEASVAEATNVLKGLVGECALALNRLVALTGISYADLDQKLTIGRAEVPRARVGRLDLVPVVAITQRPDVASAERSLAQATANIGVAAANRWPAIRLIGSIGVNQLRAGDTRTTTHLWSFSPKLSMPIFDGGKSAAALETARGVYEEVLADYRASVRNAVLEVENALVRVNAIARREDAAEKARHGYQRFFEAIAAQFREGAASLLELEEARRTLLASQQAQMSTRLEQVQAWIALYKAVGGGWRAEADSKVAHRPPSLALNQTYERD